VNGSRDTGKSFRPQILFVAEKVKTQQVSDRKFKFLRVFFGSK